MLSPMVMSDMRQVSDPYPLAHGGEPWRPRNAAALRAAPASPWSSSAHVPEPTAMCSLATGSRTWI